MKARTGRSKKKREADPVEPEIPTGLRHICTVGADAGGWRVTVEPGLTLRDLAESLTYQLLPDAHFTSAQLVAIEEAQRKGAMVASDRARAKHAARRERWEDEIVAAVEAGKSLGRIVAKHAAEREAARAQAHERQRNNERDDDGALEKRLVEAAGLSKATIYALRRRLKK